MQQQPRPLSSSSPAPPLFLPQPITGLTFWDSVLLDSVRVREKAIRDSFSDAKLMKKLAKQVEKAHEDQKKRREVMNQAKDACLSRIGKMMCRAVDKSWNRAKRGYEAAFSLSHEIEKQQHAERRQQSFLKDTERLTAFLAESFRALTSTSNSENNKQNSNNNTNNSSIPEFSTQLSLVNTLNGARPLRPYQKSALTFLINLYNNGLNAILGDEMGLGKSLMTLALLAYFAEHKQDWGPHLIVVPASILANWELECMRWVPGFKVIKYHGSAKERERLRKGWTAEGSFHICLASYSTVVHDRNIFKRRAWGFLILDEAHNIKNWKSQNWQVLFELQTTHRLLLTGTPLQTSVMELWALLRFIIPPNVAIQAAQKHLQKMKEREQEKEKDEEQDICDEDGGLAAAFENMEDFQRWFSDPLTAMVQGQATFDQNVVLRLQALLRPFFFRRLKADVEKQLPPKKEVVVLCPLSRRQKQLYEEFLSLASTKETLAVGSYLGVVRVLLSLRKVCNHPDLFAERPVASPLVLDPHYDRLIVRVPRKIFIFDDMNNNNCNQRTTTTSSTMTGTTSLVQSLLTLVQKGINDNKNLFFHVMDLNADADNNKDHDHVDGNVDDDDGNNINKNNKKKKSATTSKKKQQQRTSSVKNKKQQHHHNQRQQSLPFEEFIRKDIESRFSRQHSEIREFLSSSLAENDEEQEQEQDSSSMTTAQEDIINERIAKMKRLNSSRTQVLSNYSSFFVPTWLLDFKEEPTRLRSSSSSSLLYKYFVPTATQRIEACSETLRHFVFVVPKVWARIPMLSCPLPLSKNGNGSDRNILAPTADPHDLFFHLVRLMRTEKTEWDINNDKNKTSMSQQIRSFEPGWNLLSHYFHFPETRWVVQDCGKFFVLLPLFKKLSAEGHRVLIFTQFTGMLSILERFLAFMGLPYLRLDSQISPDERQFRVEQFNRDSRIFAMVLSTRAGGIGLNLIGADTVVFFDSDWNPAMDLQAQDRCHRIGQTRAVTIYRLVSEHTVEVNIVKKARQRKILNNLIIRSGQFHRQVGASEDDENNENKRNEEDEKQQEQKNHNAMTRETLLNFFHHRDGDEEEVVINANTKPSLDQKQALGHERNEQRNSAQEDDDEWVKATAAAEDDEDRAAESAALAEQKKAENADWLESQGEVSSLVIFNEGMEMDEGGDTNDLPRSKTNNTAIRHQQQHYVKRSFASSLTSWPPAFHQDSGVEQRLQTANQNTTNVPIESWAARTLPFFDRKAASNIRAKVRAK